MIENITAIEKRVGDAHKEALSIAVTDQLSLNIANTKTIVLKALIKEIDDTFKPIHDAQKLAAEVTKKKWADFRDPVDADFRRIKGMIGAFLTEEEQKRRKAEYEIYLANQKKIQAEGKRKRVEEAAIRRAQAAEVKGDTAKAEQILERAAVKEEKLTAKIEEATATVAVPIPIQPKTIGIYTREDWDIKIIDRTMIPPEYLVTTIDEVQIRKEVRESKGTKQIPGVENIKKIITVQRAGDFNAL